MKTPIAPLALRMSDIHVSYNEVKALRGVDFELRKGEIHALVGAHRAGKSTLIKLLCGAASLEKGQIQIQGKTVSNLNPKTALAYRIGIIHQESNLIPSLNAVENIFAGLFSRTWYKTIRYQQMNARVEEIFESLGMKMDLKSPVRRLSKAEQHMVELARLVLIDPDILVFDEISGKLNPEEMELVYKLIFKYRELGRGIIYISHNMDEIFQFSDRVTILHDGLRRGTEEIVNIDKAKLLNLTYSFVLSREELQQTNLELYNFKKYNEDILKNLPIGVIILDKERNIYLINYAAVQILSLEQHEASAKGFPAFLAKLDEETARQLPIYMEKNERIVCDEATYGDDKKLKLTIFPFRNEKYDFLGTIILIEDISFEISMKNYLIRAEKVSSIAELAAGVAHEINNPLGIILNYVELLKSKQMETDAGEKLKDIEEELHRIVEIVGSLLSFSKARDWPMERIDLPSVFDEVLVLAKHKLQEKEIQLKKAGVWQPAPIQGDWNRLKQLFLNLLMNAIEAVLQHGKITVRQTVDYEQMFVEISITDDGYGIPEEVQERIFDPFFSTKTTTFNTGLGLSICQHIVESHMGLISFTSGEETTFSVRFPLLAAHPG